MRLVDGRVQEEFSLLANPGRPLPLAVSRLTGITDRDLRHQPSSRAALARFLDFVGDDVVVVHNAEFDCAFLRHKSDGFFQNAVIDTLELSRILFPTLEHHDLDTLAAALGLDAGDRHRALDDCRLLVALWGRMLERLAALPLEVVGALSAVASLTRWPTRHLFLEAEAARIKDAFEVASLDFRKVLADNSRLLAQAREARAGDDPTDRPPPERLDVAELKALFEPGGLLEKSVPGYEVRPQQVRMVELVATAFNEGRHLLVEAGTGVGKSMAYLVPAISWATRNGEKVVVSTNTKNLQEQLFFKDLPLLRRVLGEEFTAAMIKGRGNYLCVRKLLYLLEEAERELSEDERLAFLAVLVWAAETETGDVAENTGFLAFRQRELWAKLCSAAEECPGPSCGERRRCFLAKARALAALADIVVANHAVVFSELGADAASVVLPRHDHLIFDEAHNLEDAATDFLGCQVDWWEVARFTRRLVRRPPRGTERGLLPSLRYRLKRGRERHLTDSEKHLDDLVVRTYGAVEEVEERLKGFLDSLGGVCGERPGESVRYEPESRDPQLWAVVEREKKNLAVAIGALRRNLDRIVEALQGLEERDFAHRDESICDLRGVSDGLAAVEETLEFLIKADDERYVYWVERYGRRATQYRMAAAPVRVGPVLKELLYDRKATIVFTSATLSAAGSFEFLKDRIGLDLVEPSRLIEEDVGSPFDYDRQMLVCIPSYVPEPDRDEKFVAEAARTLLEVFRASQGRGLGLFTSYYMLNQSYPKLKNVLESEGIVVLGQGFDGERRAITRMFRRDTHSVLLGTDSFWEGVDVPGEALSCLVIVKLPFAVHTAPIVQARCEEVEQRGLSPFRHYTLPSAVIRFKQGMGRLIRTKNDFGVVVVLDRRVLTRNYGRHFLRSLPTGYRTCRTPRHLADMVRAFLASRAASQTLGDEAKR